MLDLLALLLGKRNLVSPVPDPTPTPTPDPFITRGLYKTGPNSYSNTPPTPTPMNRNVNTRPMLGNTPPPTGNVNQQISQTWGAQTNTADQILAGENVQRKTGREVDIYNRINPKTGEWDANAPIMMRKNPLTGEMIKSMDRGLFRINNITFYDFQDRYPELLKKNGINDWDDMLDPMKNIIMAKIIFEHQGKGAWYGAK